MTKLLLDSLKRQYGKTISKATIDALLAQGKITQEEYNYIIGIESQQ